MVPVPFGTYRIISGRKSQSACFYRKTSGKNKRKKQAETTKRNSQAAKTIGNKQSFLAFIAENGSAGSADMAEHLGLSQARIRALLSELVEDKKIEPCGNGRTRKYVLINSNNCIQK